MPAAVRGLIEQIAILHYFGVRVVFVHGGGPQLTEITEALGVPTRMVQGRRVTDQKAIDATSMVLNGLINTKLLAFCREMDIDAVGISGVDAGLIRAHKRPPVKLPTPARRWTTASSATSTAIDTTVIKKLLDNGLMPVVSPLSADDQGTLLNINADTVAAAIGAALSAEKLMLCTGAPGILERVDDPSLDHFVHRPQRPQAPARGEEDRRRHAAEGQGDRRRHPRRRAPRARDVVQIARRHPRRSVHQRRRRHADRRRHQRAVAGRAAGREVNQDMSRLWDKGVDLDQRVLAYTAGDDYALDERLVQYDVRASIAHAEMLNAAEAAGRRRPRQRFATG